MSASLYPCPDHSGVLLRLLLAGLLTIVTSVHAVEVDDLYQVSVPVSGEDAAQRKQAVREAFGRVLVKVTGSRQVVSRSSLSSDFEDASRYVQQFRYRAPSPQFVDAEPGQLLQVRFDGGEIERLLQRRGLPVWDSNRPGILVWLGADEPGRKRRLLNPEVGTSIRAALTQAANARGLPLLFPLLDLEDQSQLQVADLWGEFEANIRAASDRYSPDLILTGRLQALDRSLWRGEWRLFYADKQSAWSDQAESQEALAASALHRVADELAARYAPLRRERSLSTVRLLVTGVHSLEDYARTLELLSNQESLERVVVVAVDADTVTYDLHGQGGQAAVVSGLAVGDALVPDLRVRAAADTLTNMIDLHYRLR